MVGEAVNAQGDEGGAGEDEAAGEAGPDPATGGDGKAVQLLVVGSEVGGHGEG